MVFINLAKLLLLIKAVQDCPSSIPKREEKLFLEYLKFKKTSDDKVSVEVPVELDRLKEIDVDKEVDDRKKKIIFHLIRTYTDSNFEFPTQTTDIYLVSPLVKCDHCHTGTLVFTRPDRQSRIAVVYTLAGPRCAKVYIKYCSQCQATVYNCYTEFSENGTTIRKYIDQKESSLYVNVTQETFFERKLLEELTEDVFTCDTRFVTWTEKYNRLHSKSETNLKERVLLNRKRVFDAWIIFSITQRIPVRFPVTRTLDGNIDIEEVCRFLYPSLKQFVDEKWLHHRCDKGRLHLRKKFKLWNFP